MNTKERRRLIALRSRFCVVFLYAESRQIAKSINGHDLTTYFDDEDAAADYGDEMTRRPLAGKRLTYVIYENDGNAESC